MLVPWRDRRMSRSLAFPLGPLTIPFPWLLFLLFALTGAALGAALFGRQVELRKRVLDVGSNALLAYFVGWKPSPLLTAFGTVGRSPLSLLYLPGGVTGILVGIAAAVVVLSAGLLRTLRMSPSRRPGRPPGRFACMQSISPRVSPAEALWPQRPRRRRSEISTIVIKGGRIVAVHPGVVTASWLREVTRQ